MSSSFVGAYHRLFHGSGWASYRAIQYPHTSWDAFCVGNEHPSAPGWLYRRLLDGTTWEAPFLEPQELCWRFKSSGLIGEANCLY
jgi:hypothetical protein